MADSWGVSWGSAWGESWRTRATLDITDTDILQKPVDCVLAGQVPYKDKYREWDLKAPNRKETGKVIRSSVRSLGGKPGYTVRTDKRGYD